MISRNEAVDRLRAAAWVKKADFQRIFTILDGKGGRTRAVGGIVRDTIIGKPDIGADLDLASELLPEEVMKRVREAGMSCYPTGIEHGTVTVRNGTATAEITTLRRDIKTDGRHAQVLFGTDWRADAKRRDFTINALYASMNGELYDPLDGLKDLVAKHVRFIGDPDQRIKEDRLRVLRFFRFSASHANEVYDPAGLAACKRAAGSLDVLSRERVGAEMLKIMALQQAAATMAMMSEIGALELGRKTIKELSDYERLTPSPLALARLAILFEAMEQKKLQEKWRLSNALVKEASEIGQAAKLILAEDFNQLAYRFFRLGFAALPVAGAIAGWDEERLHAVMEVLHNLKAPPFPISGRDLLDAGFKPGPELGDALRLVEGEWVNSGFKLERQELLGRLESLWRDKLQ
ncbi:CCA tRNA nucleotidyltransferase [hydrothermal vent metagenome]|uniref:CCA tRNA nucleotidyltransferase n=1 Tax=hydrothermal vent metagenome TaxID=652676 RepID=A0A3B0U2N7_9ZZZZ